MSENRAEDRVMELRADIEHRQLPEKARLPGDNSSWTRRRAMPLDDMVRCALDRHGLSTAMEIRRYFREKGTTENTVSKQAYLKQRRKLNFEVFKHLNGNYLKRYYHGDEAVTWHGYVVLAVDGSRAEIPDTAENRKTYGESANQYGNAVARADVSVAQDVFNHFIVDIGTYRYQDSEIEEAKAHIPAVQEIISGYPLLFMFDRNYTSVEFMDYLEKKGVKYLIRPRSGDYRHGREAMNSDDEAVRLGYTGNRLRRLGKEDPERAEELKRGGPLRARIVRMKFGEEEPGALITNMGPETGAEEIRRLYRKRWQVEKKYHTLKNKMKFESVTGNASIYVKQDFWAQTLVYNIVQDLMEAAEQKLKRDAKKKGYRYGMRINENIAIGLFKEQFIRMMVETDKGKQDRMFWRLKTDMTRNIVPVRDSPGRPRRWHHFNKYKCNQKPSF